MTRRAKSGGPWHHYLCIPYDLYPNTVILHWIWLKHVQSHMVNLQTLWCSNRKSTRAGRWSAFILESSHKAAADPSTFIVHWRRSSPTGKVQVQRSQCYYYSLVSKRIRPCRWLLFVFVLRMQKLTSFGENRVTLSNEMQKNNLP